MPRPVVTANEWIRYEKHRKANVKSWDNSDATRWTQDGPSQYNPHFYHTDQEILTVEMDCVNSGTPIDTSDPNPHEFYMYLDGPPVGACSGEKTNYVFAEHNHQGFHGRPISDKALRNKGVVI